MSGSNPSGCCSVDIDCCSRRLPDSLIATFSDVVGGGEDCQCLQGLTVPLVYMPEVGALGEWRGEKSACDGKVYVAFYCTGEGLEDFQAEVNCTGFGFEGAVGNEVAQTCDPFMWVYEDMSFPSSGECCSPEEEEEPTWTLTITE